MSNKVKVIEHLRNQALYEPAISPLFSREWKRKLLYRHSLHQQLKNALREGPRLFKGLSSTVTALICIAFAIAVYLGIVNPEYWFKNIGRIVNFSIPPIGLKEAVIFVIAVNGLTLMIRKRSFFI